MITKIDMYDIQLEQGGETVALGLLHKGQIALLVPQLMEIIQVAYPKAKLNIEENQENKLVKEPSVLQEKPTETKQKPGPKTKDLSEYVKLHESGKQKYEILDAIMLRDGVSEATAKRYWTKILELSKRVTIVAPHAGLTDEEKIEKLIRENKETLKERQKMKLPRI